MSKKPAKQDFLHEIKFLIYFEFKKAFFKKKKIQKTNEKIEITLETLEKKNDMRM